MMLIYNFNDLEYSGISYGGHSGSKRGVILDNERWFLKYPKSTRSMDVDGLSYTTMPVSEYLGSHIYSSIGIETHDTRLGISNGRVVVACKDFLNNSEVILDYNAIKNDYDENIERKLESLSSFSNSYNNDIEEIMLIMDNNDYFKKIPDLKDRFWDMFIIDALISNNDRNDGNWGLILDKETRKLRVSPVFDNGACFYNKSDDFKIESILNNDFKFKQVAYDSSVSIYEENGRHINPLKYIQSMKNSDCNKALLRIFSKINLDKIKKLFEEIPNMYDGLIVLSKNQKELYYNVIEYRYYEIFKPIYDKLKDIENL